MNAALISGLVAFAVCFAGVPAVMAFCKNFGLLDQPGPLKIHNEPVPRLGGAALFAALCIGIFVASKITNTGPPRGFLAAVSVVWLAGAIDDVRGLHIGIRLMAQVCAGLLLWEGGYRVLAGNQVVSAILICAVVVLFVNSWNFADGRDGLCAAITCAVAAAYLSLGLTSRADINSSNAAAVFGSCAAFLKYNLPPSAKIFMGDSGSTVLGLSVASLSLQLSQSTRNSNSHISLICFAILVAALPLLDAILTILRRILRGKSAWYGDRSHFYDRLCLRGLSSAHILAVSCATMVLLSAAGIYAARESANVAITITGLLLIILLVLDIKLGALRLTDITTTQNRSRASRQSCLVQEPPRA